MGDARFDSLTRALAAGSSRRQGIRVLASVGAALIALGRSAGHGASAHHARLGPGDPCLDSSQCLAADAPLVCADNGFAFDGSFNCCTYVGSRCGFDEGCCGDAACIDGFCASIQDYAGSGERCRDSSMCAGADAPLTCDYVGVTDDYRCCAPEGSRCGWNGGCCGWLRCGDDGFCTGSPPTGCNSEGCECDFQDPNACAPGLVCCAVQSGFICATWADCGGQ